MKRWNRPITIIKWQLNALVVVGFSIGFTAGVFTSLQTTAIFADTSDAGHYQWTFASSEGYNLSDSNLIEVTGTSTRLKVRNYTSDANTKFLAHFDESSGTTVTDSSSNANSGSLTLPAPTPATIWTTGKLDGANSGLGGLRLDGQSMAVSVPDDSDKASVTQSMTLEAWVKFNSAFSAGSANSRQPVMDKGEYQLYFDNQTGKLVYEVVSNAAQTWAQKGGGELARSWDLNGKTSVTSAVKTSQKLYVGTGSSVGDGEVWEFNGTSDWNIVGGYGINSSWSDNVYDDISGMVAYGEDLIVAGGNADGDGDLWYYDYSASSWSQIAGDSGAATAGYSWNTGINLVTGLAINGSKLYAGTGNAGGEGDLWVCDLAVDCTRTSGWTQIGGDSGGAAAGYSWNTNFEQVWDIHFIGDQVYVALGSSAGDAEVWTCNTATGCTQTSGWTKIGGDGVFSSWNTVYEIVHDLASYTDTAGKVQLVAGLGVTAGDAEIWRCNVTDTTNCTTGAGWGGAAIVDGNTGTGTDPQAWGSAYERVWQIVIDDQLTTDYIYVGLGESSSDAELYRCDLAGTCNNTTGWTKLGGDSVNSSWSSANVRRLYLDGTTLYAGIAGVSQLWKYDGSWSLVGGNFRYGSWSNSLLDRVTVIDSCGGKLYAGTGSGTGDATVWQYDGTTWDIIGGNQTNSSWAYNTIEAVESMTCYQAKLYVGLGNTANSDDGQVWKFDPLTAGWVQVAGNGASGTTGGWGDADNMEAVYSLAADGTYLYAGTGNSTDDGKVWRFDASNSTWTQIAGRKTSALTNGTWQDADNIEAVLSLLSDGNYLYAGLGLSADDGEVWQFDKTAQTWTQIANAGAASNANGAWNNTTDIEGVYSLGVYQNALYAGLGASTADAKVYKYDGTNWTHVAGNGADAGFTGWPADYEYVRSMASFNGYLFASLGNGDGESEVWKFNGTSWSQAGGDSVGSSWPETDNFNTAYGLTVFKGKLYAGTGDGSQAETTVWAYGDNLYVESDSAVTDTTNWHHYAASYNGATAYMYIDGVVQTNTDTGTISVDNQNRPLLIGTSYGNTNASGGRGHLDAAIDEVRVSDTARSSSSFVLTPFTASAVTIQPATKRLTSQIDDWSAFAVTEGGVGTVKYCLSSDGGTTWKSWGGSSWATSSCTSLANSSTSTEVNDHIGTFPVTSDGVLWKAVLVGDGSQQVQINTVRVDGTTDIVTPSDPANATLRVGDAGGALLTGGSSLWYGETDLYFEWDESTDAGSGMAGYYVYFGLDSSADPESAGTFQVGSTLTTTATQSGALHLLLKAKDNASNKSQIVDAFTYQYDGTAPDSPATITASPSVYSSTNSFSFSWSAVTDPNSQLAGYQYAATSSAALASWSASTTSTSVSLMDVAYTSGANRFYVRSVDNAGNVTASPSYATFYYAGSGPGPVRNLAVDETPKSENNFTFTWDAPDTGSYLGTADELRYCYMLNRQPSALNAEEHCTWTAAGVTAVGPDNFATQQTNTFWIVAKNPDAYGATIDYANAQSVDFVANTSSPGIPTSVEVSDISIKNSSTWRLTVSWAPPSDIGSGISSYKVYVSTDDSTYTYLGSTTGTAYVDTGLSQILYYYKVRACDDADNCGALSTAASETPTGKYTAAAGLTSGPTVSSITTKKATIEWTTDRTSDSKIQYGTSAGNYGSVEPGNSSHVTSHSLALTNLLPGTTYYYKAKWTDEDGNTGTSSEKSFTTTAAPTVKDAQVKNTGLSSAFVQFTSTGAASAKIYYGKTTAFGGIATISTSSTESTYTKELTGLEDGVKYYYKINTFDSESAEYEGTILSFTTLPRPKISTVRIQQVRGTAQPTVLVSWETNTETSSIVTFYPAADPASAKDEVNVALIKGSHRMIVRGLQPETGYVLVVRGRDRAGNEASSDPQKFDTATDTRPAQISDLRVEGSVMSSSGGSQSDQTAQIVVSWNTDEPTTSQVEFGEGSGSVYAQKTQEDANLTLNHLVIISGLSPSKVYHLRAISKDKANNIANSVDTVTITPKVTENALNLVMGSLQEAFGFLDSGR